MTIDVVLRNGRWYRGGGWDPDMDAIAVSGGRIVAMGAGADLVDRAGTGTQVVDLEGRYALPGFKDAHVHPGQGGLERGRCDLSASRSAADYSALIKAYAQANPATPWILGGGWSLEAFSGGNPTADVLDALVPDRPAFLPNRDHHSAWVNGLALRLAGIDANTPDPSDGRIERDADGTPSGALHEGAMELVARFIPPTSEEEIGRGLLRAQDHLFSLGITGWQDALVGDGLGMPDTLEAYCALLTDGSLSARVSGALWWDRTRGLEQIEELVQRRERARQAGFDAGTVKIMQDGVCETFTAAVLEDYLDGHGHRTGNRGLDFIEPALLAEYTAELDSVGFQLHIHALGDRAVRDSLDAIEHARNVNGPSGLRHHLAHLQLVHPDDVGRFAALGVTANAQLLWACNDVQMAELTLPFLSPAARERQYVFGSLAAAGVRIAAGSDWPVSDPDPLAAMHVAVHRTEPPSPSSRHPAGLLPLLPGEALTVQQAVSAFTTGSSYVCRLDDAGTIELDMLADVTVLDSDILAPDPDAISAAVVDKTIIGGRIVYAR